MLWLYRLVFVPAAVVAAPYYLWRMRRRGGYREDFGQRFGVGVRVPERRPGVRRVWLQAVSVGEMLAIAPIMEAFKAMPKVEVYLTTTTSTGYRLAKEHYGAQVIGIGYFPLDAWPCAAAAWRRVQPDLAILTEGERWPEHIHQAARRHVPVVCVNARLSDRSYERMARVRWLVQPLLGGITRLLACSEPDAERFRRLGFSPASVSTTGSIKLDVPINAPSAEIQADLRRELGFGVDDFVLLGSSTWPGEEEAMIEAFRAVRTRLPDARLLLVPRHAERRGDIEAFLKGTGFAFHLRSRGAAERPMDVTLADTTGELRKLTSLASLVFVGKSLGVHHEGQTPVEAAALGKAVLFGPVMSNFRTIALELRECGAARAVSDAEALRAACLQLALDGEARSAMAEAGRTWHRASRGAVGRTMAAITAELAGGERWTGRSG